VRGSAILAGAAALSLAVGSASAADVYVIRNARIHPVSGPVIEKGSVVIKDGLIADVGANVSAPAGAEAIDATGLDVYPGLMDANSGLGMGEARETAMGDFLPELQVYASFHMDDDNIEMAVENAVTHVLSRPYQRGAGNNRVRQRMLISGQAAVMDLEGWTPDERARRKDVGVVVNFPTVGSLEYSDDERFAVVPWSARKKAYDKQVADLKAFFAQARDYMARKEKLSATERAAFEPDLRLEAMIPVLKRERPLLLDADLRADIVAAIEFAKAEKVTPIVMSGEEAVMVADFLKQSDVTVILAPAYTVPEGEDDPIDLLHGAAAALYEKGVRFAIASHGSVGYDSRSLGYQAGTSVAYGLPYEVALRAVTLTPAEIFGVADMLGSIENGKRANIVVAQGDLLDVSSKVTHVFIAGRAVDLATRFDRSYATYAGRK
jgi:imidazolonepropionase-like amidohydrolase